MRSVVILGSTGSVGTQALEVIAAHRDRFDVVGLAAGGGRIDLLARQVLDVQPRYVGVTRSSVVQDLQLALYAEVSRRGWSAGATRLPKIIAGPDAASELAAVPADVVLNAIDGAAGLAATLAVLRTGAVLALANKESLVIGGRLVTDAARPGQLVAVDSEHSAITQCLRAGRADEVDRIVLTASGGPFRGRTRAELTDVTPADAMAHPTWDMGHLITTNSATLVNKGLELIEAHLLFGVDLDRIDVVVHPQSVVHSMVQFVDGSTVAQCSPPDMRLPIALGLAWPERLAEVAPAVDWTTAATWTFEPLDAEAFPAVEVARACGRRAGTMPAVFNAANEVCVAAFHAGRIRFTDIVDTVRRVLDAHDSARPGGLGADIDSPGWVPSEELTVSVVLAADRWARLRAAELTGEPTRTGPA